MASDSKESSEQPQGQNEVPGPEPAAAVNLDESPGLAPTAAYEPATMPDVLADRYVMKKFHARGGMGEVWLAEQSEPVKRRVALKILKLGMDTKQIVARFESERQSLAVLDHPNIAKIFDGGMTESGRPYFAMECVHGVPITEYCDTQRLSTRSRLRLFIEVCSAVQHAHLKGLIHRDIKPTTWSASSTINRRRRSLISA